MTASSFLFYNIMGGIGWVTICMGAGFLFGNVPVIKENFTLCHDRHRDRIGPADGV